MFNRKGDFNMTLRKKEMNSRKEEGIKTENLNKLESEKETNEYNKEDLKTLEEHNIKNDDNEKQKLIITNEKSFIRGMIVLMMMIFLGNGAICKACAQVGNNNPISLFQQNDSKESDNKQRDIEEKKDSTMVGTSEEGKKYAYDAVEVERKLKNYDYSNDGKKMVFLTFDDGASTTVTPKILETLDKYDVKATFFVMGKTIEDGGEAAKTLIRKEFNSGNAIGNHSYSHDYKILFPGRSLNFQAFKADFDKNDKILKDILGDNFSTRVIRCPGGHMSWKNMAPLDEYLNDNNMASIDWSAYDSDAEGKKKTANELVDYAVKSAKGKDMVVMLMHDTYGKEETAKALPQIIEHFKQQGYEFRTLA